MLAKVIQGESPEELELKLNKVVSPSFQPSLAILFCSVHLDLSAVIRLFTSKGIQVFGASSAGEIADDEVGEFSAVAMLLDLNPDYFSLIQKDTLPGGTQETTIELAKEGTKCFHNPVFLALSSGITIDGEEITNGFQEVLGSNPAVFGGLAGDDFEMEKTFVFTNDLMSSNGIAVLVLNGDMLEVEGIASCGWEEVGIEKTITHAEGNVVYTIDNEPAMDVFVKYFGLPKDLDPRRGVVDVIGVQYPLKVIREDGNSVIRAPLVGNGEDRSLIFAGKVQNGAKVKFTVPPGFDVINKTVKEIGSLKDSLPSADALVLFSCKARHMAFGSMVEEEITGIRKFWNAPMIGFFTYGEFGTIPGSGLDFHNETCSLVVIREKRPI